MLRRIAIYLVLSACIGLPVANAFGQAEEKVDSQSQQDPFEIVTKYVGSSGQQVPHPDFILPLITDPSKTIQLSKYRGKKVLLLHFASW